MIRILALCLLLLSLPASALSSEVVDVVEEHGMSDPLARRIVSTGTLEAPYALGPPYAHVTMFSVPEPDGSGERLYFGFVDDLLDHRSNSQLWRGPVAVRWKDLRNVSEYRSGHNGPKPNRYRVDRQTVQPGGRLQTTTMEINLEARTPLLIQLGGEPGQPKYLGYQPLGESLPMNDSLRMLVRLFKPQVFQTGALRLCSYKLHPGSCAFADRMDSRSWYTTPAPHLLAISSKTGLGQTALRFLPVRPDGWTYEKLLASPAKGDVNGSFVLQMIAPYLAPHSQGGLMLLGARYRVSISLKELDISSMELGLWNNPDTEAWEPGSGESKIRYVPKP